MLVSKMIRTSLAVIVIFLTVSTFYYLHSGPAEFGDASPLQAFDKVHFDSFLWGTYRPGVYFGTKSRTFPESVSTGLMWQSRENEPGGDGLRHECSMNDALKKYRWRRHDGETFAVQDIIDEKGGIELTTTLFLNTSCVLK